MSEPAPLPLPDPDARALSAELTARIAAEIGPGGWIDFARYMELALYAPGLGYYAGGSTKLGEAGDFITAPELSPLFGRTVARPVAQVLSHTGGDVLELGAGSGRLAHDLLLELAALGTLPARYAIVEVSAELRERQSRLLARLPDTLRERVQWLDTLPSQITGVVLANEVLDALPVHVVGWYDEGIRERGVTWTGDRLTWAERPLQASPLLERAREIAPPPPYRSEINLLAPALIASLAQSLQRGLLLLFDYGFGEREYYHPQRNDGTLMCHYRHRAHDDPFFHPGLQDITSHVDFTAAAVAGVQAGLRLAGYTTQAMFLIDAGITDVMSRTPPEDAAAYLPQAAQVQKLTSPAEMGELFKALALARDVDIALPGFRTGDRSRLL